MTACFLRAEASLLQNLIALTSRVVASVAKRLCAASCRRVGLLCGTRPQQLQQARRLALVEDQLSAVCCKTGVELVRATTALADA